MNDEESFRAPWETEQPKPNAVLLRKGSGSELYA